MARLSLPLHLTVKMAACHVTASSYGLNNNSLVVLNWSCPPEYPPNGLTQSADAYLPCHTIRIIIVWSSSYLFAPCPHPMVWSHLLTCKCHATQNKSCFQFGPCKLISVMIIPNNQLSLTTLFKPPSPLSSTHPTQSLFDLSRKGLAGDATLVVALKPWEEECRYVLCCCVTSITNFKFYGFAGLLGCWKLLWMWREGSLEGSMPMDVHLDQAQEQGPKIPQMQHWWMLLIQMAQRCQAEWLEHWEK